jgi:hypothetical protein
MACHALQSRVQRRSAASPVRCEHIDGKLLPRATRWCRSDALTLSRSRLTGAAMDNTGTATPGTPETTAGADFVAALIEDAEAEAQEELLAGALNAEEAEAGAREEPLAGAADKQEDPNEAGADFRMGLLMFNTNRFAEGARDAADEETMRDHKVKRSSCLVVHDVDLTLALPATEGQDSLPRQALGMRRKAPLRRRLEVH